MAKSTVIFQCAACRTIVGDSLALVRADEAREHVTLSAACNLRVNKAHARAKAARASPDAFNELACAGPDCSNVLGKQWLLTSAEMDELRGLFTLETAKLLTYEPGAATSTVESETEDGRAVLAPGHGAGPGLDIPSAAQVDALTAELVKLQEVMLHFDERLESLEEFKLAAEVAGQAAAQAAVAHDGVKSAKDLAAAAAAAAAAAVKATAAGETDGGESSPSKRARR